jgi:hypothetical protein
MIKMEVWKGRLHGTTALSLGAADDGLAPLFSEEFLAGELWPAAKALVSVLERRQWRRRLQLSSRVVDLGAGTGACGLAAAALGAQRVLCTDTAAVLPALTEIVLRNRSVLGRASVSCDALDWSEPVRASVGGADVVLASDCLNSVYGQMAPCLAGTIAELLRRAPAHAIAPPPVSLVAQTQRTTAETDEFLKHCQREGLVATELWGRGWVSPQGPVRCFMLRFPHHPSRASAQRRAAAGTAALAVLLAPLLLPRSPLSLGWAQAALGRLSEVGRSTLASVACIAPSLSPLRLAASSTAREQGQEAASPCAAILLSQRPRVYLLRGLINQEEAAGLIALSQGRMQPSQLGAAGDSPTDHLAAMHSGGGRDADGVVGGEKDGNAAEREPAGIGSRHRTSASITLSSDADASSSLVAALRRRWSDAARMPLAMAEPMQLSRYAPGEGFGLHLDADPAGNVPRAATLLAYLSDGFEGGETVFPRVEVKYTAGGVAAPLPHLSKLVAAGGEALLAAELARGLERYCGPQSRVLRVAPRVGDAILFFPLAPDLTIDLDAVHGGCPPADGGRNKWIAQQWWNFDPAQAGAQSGRDEPAARGAEALNRRAAAAALGRLRKGWREAAP